MFPCFCMCTSTPFVCLSLRLVLPMLPSHCREKGTPSVCLHSAAGSGRGSTHFFFFFPPGFLTLQTKPFRLLSVQLKTAALSGLLLLQDSFRLRACVSVCLRRRQGGRITHTHLLASYHLWGQNRRVIFPGCSFYVCVCVCVYVMSDWCDVAGVIDSCFALFHHIHTSQIYHHMGHYTCRVLQAIWKTTISLSIKEICVVFLQWLNLEFNHKTCTLWYFSYFRMIRIFLFSRGQQHWRYNTATAAAGGDAVSLITREGKAPNHQMTLADHHSEPHLRFLKKKDFNLYVI